MSNATLQLLCCNTKPPTVVQSLYCCVENIDASVGSPQHAIVSPRVQRIGNYDALEDTYDEPGDWKCYTRCITSVNTNGTYVTKSQSVVKVTKDYEYTCNQIGL